MDARRSLVTLLFCAAVSVSLTSSSLWAAGARTRNFIVQASTPELAQEIALAAETFRRDLSIEWLGQELPPWPEVCPITADIDPRKGAGGATSFSFTQGHPHGWTMNIQGSRERAIDSVLPHEITHTIFATHFGRPLPRWADEGACTTVEHVSEKTKQEKMLYEFLTTNRGIPFNRMFAMKDYPPDVLPLYSQGFSLARYFIALGGKRKFVDYVGTGMHTNRWTETTQQFYGFATLSDLQLSWLEWVRSGTPEIRDANDVLYASTDPAKHGRTLAQVLGLPAAEHGVQLASAVDEIPTDFTNATPINYSSGKIVPKNLLPSPLSTVRPVGNLERINSDVAEPAFASNATSVSPHRNNPARDEEDTDYASRSRPLSPEPVRPTVLEWSRGEKTLVPAGTKWR